MYYGFNDISFTDNHDEVTTPLRNLNVHDRVFQRHPSQSHNDHIIVRGNFKGLPFNPQLDNNKFSGDIMNGVTKVFDKFVKGNKNFFF